MTMGQSRGVNQQQKVAKRRKNAFWSGLVRVRTLTQLRCCDITSRGRFTPEIP